MRMDDALEINKPAPDSQYRLRPCENCGGDNVAYVKYRRLDGDRWRVQCFSCGMRVDPDHPAPRHEVQMLWNRRANTKTEPAATLYHTPEILTTPKTPPIWDMDDDRETCGLLEED